MGAKITRMPKLPDPRLLQSEMVTAMEETTEFAKEAIVDVVETSGTDREWSRPWYGRTGSGRGRVDTGEMRDAVKAQTSNAGDVIYGNVGWLDGDPEHARFQELGFRHYLTGQMIEGMHALSSVRDEVYQEFASNALNAIRRSL